MSSSLLVDEPVEYKNRSAICRTGSMEIQAGLGMCEPMNQTRHPHQLVSERVSTLNSFP